MATDLSVRHLNLSTAAKPGQSWAGALVDDLERLFVPA